MGTWPFYAEEKKRIKRLCRDTIYRKDAAFMFTEEN